jgi:hypothetical protein
MEDSWVLQGGERQTDRDRQTETDRQRQTEALNVSFTPAAPGLRQSSQIRAGILGFKEPEVTWVT